MDKSHTERAYRLILALSNTESIYNWITLAQSLLLPGGEIHLRGLVVVPPEKSLSEGVTQAQQMRDLLDKAARSLEIVSDEVRILVDYQPMERLLDELQDSPVDLLLVQWAGPVEPTGGIDTNAILQHAPCDVVLVCGETWYESGPALLSLRGGPNIWLGLRVAGALAADSSITLFHAADNPHHTPDLNPLIQLDPRIRRTVTAVSDIGEGIIREAVGHKVIILGATFRQPEWASSESSPVMRVVYERVQTPLVLVRAYRPEALALLPTRPLLRPKEDLSTRVDRWFAENTFHSSEFVDLRALVALKERQGVTISLGLPALNEEATVGKVIGTLKQALVEDIPLLDEIVLIDSNSTDATVPIAQSYGIPTYRHPEILPEVGSYVGKGEALWKSLHVLTGDLIVWIDTDITNIHPRFVYGLIGPLLRRSNIQYVKGFYQRPIRVGGQLQAGGGGRVTELVARPLLNLFYPELSGVIQPLSGEYAGRRAALESVPFFSGYGVETGLLIDLHDQFGLEAIAQVDLEERIHHNQPLVGLSKMSFAIHQVFISRLEKRYGVQLLDKANRSMKLIIQEPERFALDVAEIGDAERPPMNTIAAYRARLSQPDFS